ncbi:putative GNAT family acetyltransferase [Marisediminicola sp. UYEF4]|uniref:GNAT family N-acetyltransferase n=1 Tax=Marisediminicola sp. UYEF4 TaxID=1756384 RepID=UPI003394EC6D
MTELRNLVAENQYLFSVGGEEVGLADYRVIGDEIHITHTEITPRLRGSGLGARMVRALLDSIRSDTDYRVIADCGFVRDFLRRNPEYAELQTRRTSSS